MLAATSYFDRLIEFYGENNALIGSIIAINDAVIGDPTPYFKQVFEENISTPSPSEIQERLLSLYMKSKDIQYLEAYNEIAIRAERINKGSEFFPISSTYPKFEAILRENGLTLEGLAIERNRLLEGLAIERNRLLEGLVKN